MQEQTLIPEADALNYNIDTACLTAGNPELQQDYIASAAEAFSEICKVLAKEKELRYRLVYYALRNIRLYFAADSFNSLTANDVVQIVIEKILTGIRRWNKNLVPDIRKLLFLSIKSFIRNEKRRIRNLALMDIDTLKPELNSFSLNSFFSEMHRRDLNEDIFPTDFQILISKLKAQLSEDVYASFVLDEILDGAESNIEIAESLNIPIKDVENAKKRIRNKSSKLLNNSG